MSFLVILIHNDLLLIGKFSLIWFYGISTIVAYLMSNSFLYIFYFKQFSLA